jgi:hypothetical protein
MKVKELIGELMKANQDLEVELEIETKNTVKTFEIQTVHRTNYVSLTNTVTIIGGNEL